MKSYGNILAERRFLAKNWSEVLQTNEFWVGFHPFIDHFVKLKFSSFKLSVHCSQSCETDLANFGVVLSCCNFASAFRRSNHKQKLIVRSEIRKNTKFPRALMCTLNRIIMLFLYRMICFVLFARRAQRPQSRIHMWICIHQLCFFQLTYDIHYPFYSVIFP